VASKKTATTYRRFLEFVDFRQHCIEIVTRSKVQLDGKSWDVAWIWGSKQKRPDGWSGRRRSFLRGVAYESRTWFVKGEMKEKKWRVASDEWREKDEEGTG